MTAGSCSAASVLPVNRTTTMTLLSTESSAIASDRSRSAAELPTHDVRLALDQSVLRGWSEMSRRVGRIGVLLLFDSLGGLIGVATALLSWDVVSNEGMRPLPRAIPLIAMVFCIQPLALHVIGCYGGGKRAESRAARRRRRGHRLRRVGSGATLRGGCAGSAKQDRVFVFGRADHHLRLARPASARRGDPGRVQTGILQRRALVVGEPDEIRDLKALTESGTGSDVAVVGGLSTSEAIGARHAIRDAVRAAGAHVVLITPSVPFDEFRGWCSSASRVAWGCRCCRARSGARRVVFRAAREPVGVLLDVFPLKFRLPQLAVKRGMDLLLTTVVLFFSRGLCSF